MFDLNGKLALVTGSSRGIGKACAIYLAKNGFDIVLHCNKNISKAEEVLTEIKEIGVNGRILQFDIKLTSNYPAINERTEVSNANVIDSTKFDVNLLEGNN